MQKFTNQLLPRLIRNAQGSPGKSVAAPLPMLDKRLVDPVVQTAYLVGLSSLIRAIPKATYAHEMPAVSKLFFLLSPNLLTQFPLDLAHAITTSRIEPPG